MTIARILLVWGLSLLFLAMPVSAEPQEEGTAAADEMAGRTDPVLPNVTARSAVVMEASTGRVIYARDMKARRFPASTTKAMTLIVALEKGNPDDIVVVSGHAAGTDGSTLWLEQGDRIRLEDLLYGIMMVSGNDGTVAIAEHIAGSVESFAGMMTKKAHEIGASDTFFVNSHGLPDERHYTTAYDMALIASYGYRNPRFLDIVSTKEKSVPWTRDAEQFWRNENQMLWLYEGANGVKTGYTEAAGRCLVAGAKRNGIQLVSVVLDSIYMWNDTIAMLDYGFQHIRTVQIVKKGETVAELPVLSGRRKLMPIKTAGELDVPVGDDGTAGYEKVYDLPNHLKAPVRAGNPVGKARVLYEGKEIGSVELVAAESAEMKSFFMTVYQLLMKYIH